MILGTLQRNHEVNFRGTSGVALTGSAILE